VPTKVPIVTGQGKKSLLRVFRCQRSVGKRSFVSIKLLLMDGSQHNGTWNLFGPSVGFPDLMLFGYLPSSARFPPLSSFLSRFYLKISWRVGEEIASF